MFKYAIDMEIVATNFALLVELPTNEASEIHKPFSRDELAELWKHTDDLGARVALILCYTGMRPTELTQVKISDVDLTARYMRGGQRDVASSWYAFDSFDKFGLSPNLVVPPLLKWPAGKNRVIPIAEKIVPLVESFYNPANEYLLTVDGKAVLNGQNLRMSIWKKNLLLKNHLPHDGRHTCATLMDDAEIPLKIKQLILGHSAGDITSKVYTHKTIKQLIDAINKI